MGKNATVLTDVHSLSIARNKNHVPDGYETEKLPQGLRKANACGGWKRWPVGMVPQVKLHIQRSRKALSRGREAPAFTHGAMSLYRRLDRLLPFLPLLLNDLLA